MAEASEESRILRVLRLYASRVLEPQAQVLREFIERGDKNVRMTVHNTREEAEGEARRGCPKGRVEDDKEIAREL